MEIIAANEISMMRVTIRVEMRENPWLFARRVRQSVATLCILCILCILVSWYLGILVSWYLGILDTRIIFYNSIAYI